MDDKPDPTALLLFSTIVRHLLLHAGLSSTFKSNGVVILSILVTGSCTGLIIHLLKKVQMDMIGLYKARELECNRCIFPKSIRNINM